MDFSIILIIIGIISIIISFFLKDPSKKLEKDLEELSINIYQETNGLNRRLKIVEEELLLEPNFQIPSKSTNNDSNAIASTVKQNPSKLKPINEILVRQVIELHKQGYNLNEIQKMSTLNKEQIQSILQFNGGNQ